MLLLNHKQKQHKLWECLWGFKVSNYNLVSKNNEILIFNQLHNLDLYGPLFALIPLNRSLQQGQVTVYNNNDFENQIQPCSKLYSKTENLQRQNQQNGQLDKVEHVLEKEEQLQKSTAKSQPWTLWKERFCIKRCIRVQPARWRTQFKGHNKLD